MKNLTKLSLVLIILLVISWTDIIGQDIKYIKVPELEKIMSYPDNKLFVVSFWASWCAPCVSEIADFETVAKEYDSDRVKFILISLDFPSQIDQQLIPFLKKNGITLDVSVMTNLDYNSWIDKVDSKWGGNIPATLFFNNSKNFRLFHPDELNAEELRQLINLNI